MFPNAVFFGFLLSHASARSVGSPPRAYNGPGDYLGDIAGRLASRAEDSSIVSYALQVLGEDTVLDCLANSNTDEDVAAHTAADLAAKTSHGAALEPGFCIHSEIDHTMAQVCSKGSQVISINSKQLKVAFDLLQERCTKQGRAGTLKTPSMQYHLYAKASVGGKTSAGSKVKRACVNPSNALTTGCLMGICEPKIRTNGEGNCPINKSNENPMGCANFCEQRAAKYWGVPEPFEGAQFCPGTGCYLEKGVGYSIEKSISLNFERAVGGGVGPISGSFAAGISFGITWGVQHSVTEGYTFGQITNGKGEQENACGFWMKVPVMLQSCGVFSEYEEPLLDPKFPPLGCHNGSPLIDTVQDACSDTMAKTLSGNQPAVIIVPRYHDCASQAELPMERQSEQWRRMFGASNHIPRACSPEEEDPLSAPQRPAELDTVTSPGRGAFGPGRRL